MPVVKFTKENKEITVPEGTNLRRAAIDAGVELYNGLNGIGASINKYVNCYGFGQCATCVVKITKGMENASKMGLMEKARFYAPVPDPKSMDIIGNEDTMRMACQVKVEGDMEVETGPELNLYSENFFS